MVAEMDLLDLAVSRYWEKRMYQGSGEDDSSYFVTFELLDVFLQDTAIMRTFYHLVVLRVFQVETSNESVASIIDKDWVEELVTEIDDPETSQKWVLFKTKHYSS